MAPRRWYYSSSCDHRDYSTQSFLHVHHSVRCSSNSVRIQTQQMRSYYKKAFGKDKTNNMHVFMNPPSTTYGLVGQFRSGRRIQLAKNFENVYPETSKEFDAACDKAWASKTAAEAEPYIVKMQGLVARECSGIAIGNVAATNLWRSEVKGFDVNTCVTLRTRDISLG